MRKTELSNRKTNLDEMEIFKDAEKNIYKST